MKITTLFAGLSLSLLIWTGCQNKTNTTTVDAAGELNQTRGTAKADAAPATTASAKKVLLARKWVNGDKFMNISLDATFTANLGNGEISVSWELNEESGALVFNGSPIADGKGQAEKLNYTLKEITDAQLKIADAAGTEWEFSAQ